MRTEDPNSYWKFWKSLKPRNSTKGPTLSQFVKYFEEQVYPPHVDYFDYDHMNNITKLVKSSLNDINEKVENGQSDLLQFLNSPITIDEIQKAIRKLKCKKAVGIDVILWCVVPCVTSMINYYYHDHDYVSLLSF